MPELSPIPLCAPEIRGREWEYVKECLDTGWVSSAGPFVERFEHVLASRLGAQYAVAAVNGTAALHLALLVAGVRPGDEVLVSTLTFIAPVNAVRYAGAWPVLIDAEPYWWQMDPERVAGFLDRRCRWRDGALYNAATGRRIRAVLPVHILGHPADLDPILGLAQKYGLAVIEDATEALGATYKGREAGRLGDVSCLSFNGNKLITTGGGGMLLTDDAGWAAKARYLSTQAKDDPLEYIHREIGYNYRLTNIQAAMGVAQAERLDEYIEAKKRIAARYNDAFAAIPGLEPMREAPWASSAWWMYTVLVDQDIFGLDSRGLLRALAERGIQTRPLWQPLHLSAAHAAAPRVECPVAEDLNRRALSLPCSVGLTAEQQDRVIDAIASLARRRSYAATNVR